MTPSALSHAANEAIPKGACKENASGSFQKTNRRLAAGVLVYPPGAAARGLRRAPERRFQNLRFSHFSLFSFFPFFLFFFFLFFSLSLFLSLFFSLFFFLLLPPFFSSSPFSLFPLSPCVFGWFLTPFFRIFALFGALIISV